MCVGSHPCAQIIHCLGLGINFSLCLFFQNTITSLTGLLENKVEKIVKERSQSETENETECNLVCIRMWIIKKNTQIKLKSFSASLRTVRRSREQRGTAGC